MNEINEKLAGLILLKFPKDESVSDACERSGLGRDTYYRIIKTKGNIDLITFYKVAALLKSPPYKILSQMLSKSELESSLQNKTYRLSKVLLSAELKKILINLREKGVTIESLFYEEISKEGKSKKIKIEVEKRHFERILSGKRGCSLKVYLNICQSLRLDPVEFIKTITIEEE